MRIGATLALLGVAVSGFMIASLALFTDSETVDSNVFTTGTVDIATSPTTAAFSPGAMAPGDEVTATIAVTNSGTLSLRYALTSTTTENVLASQLQLTVRVGVTDCSVANWDASGTEVAATDILGSTTTDPVFGSVAQGAQAGDRTLAPAGSENLCMHVSLPIGANNTSQGQTTTATFGFEAEQTRNN
jgi:predicted ribosomally synthesized peptide with SipW-like signal peptide